MSHCASHLGLPDQAGEELERSILLFDAASDRLAAGEARVWLAGTRLRAGEGDGLDALQSGRTHVRLYC